MGIDDDTLCFDSQEDCEVLDEDQVGFNMLRRIFLELQRSFFNLTPWKDHEASPKGDCLSGMAGMKGSIWKCSFLAIVAREYISFHAMNFAVYVVSSLQE